MQLKSDWRDVLRKAWSIRFIILAGVLSGAEVVIPFFSDAIPRGPFAALSFAAVAGAFIARIMAQKDL
jgi:hypothetical protein